MNQFILRLASFVLLVATASGLWAQQQSVVTSQEGNKVYLELDLHGLIQDLNTLHAAQSNSQAALSNLTWSSLLSSGTTPGMDVNFFGYDLTGLGNLAASGTLVADSLILNQDAAITGRLTVGGVGEFADSLMVGGVVEFADSLRVVKSVSIGERLFVTGITRLGDSLQVVGNVDLNALFNVDGAATFGSSMTVAGVASFGDSLLVSGVAVLGDSLNVGGNAHLQQNLQVDGDVNFAGELLVAGEASFADTVSFSAPALFADSASFAGNVNMAGGLSVSSLSINGVTIPAMDSTDDLPEGATNLYYTDSRAQGAFTEGTGVSLTGGVIAIGQPVSATDDVAFDDLAVDSIAATGVLSVSGLALFGDSINVSGNAHLKQDLQVDGNVNFGGGLVVAGETSFGDTVNFSAPALFADSASFVGNVNMAGDLSVSSLSISGVTIPAMDSTDDLPEGATNLYYTDSRARGAFTEGTGVSLTGGVIAIGQPVSATDDVAFDDLAVDTVIASGMLSVNGLALLGDSLNVSGNTHLQQDLQVDGDVNFGGGLTVNGAASFADTVDFSAPALFADSASFAGNVSMAGDLSVSSLSINGVNMPAMDSTDDLPEGATNLYYTDSRAQGAFTEGTGVSLTGGAIAIGQSVGTSDDVTFDDLTVDSIAAAGSLTIAGKGMFNDSLHVTGGATFQATLQTDSLITGGLSVAGGVRIQDGSQADGKVLVSDSVGNATWQTAPSAYTAGTGVSITDNAISIGQAVADSSEVAFAKVATDSVVTSALRLEDGNQGAGRFLMSDADGNARWGDVSSSGALVFTEAITMRGETQPITKPTNMLVDEISLVDDGTGWCTVDMQYAFLDATGWGGIYNDRRVFQLPASYEFELDYHSVSTGVNMLQSENGWGYGGMRAMLPGSSGWANNNQGNWNKLRVVPFSATEFRLAIIPGGGDVWNWVGAYYHLNDPHYVQVSFRFKKDPPPTLATVSTSAASDLGPESAMLNGAVADDGNDPVTATGFVWGEQANLSDGASLAGSATSGAFTADLTGLTAGNTYYYTAFVTNSVGTSYGDTVSFAAPYFACSNSSVTYDGVAYGTVAIGDQCWFAQNLQTDQYRDGSPIPGSLSNAEWTTTTSGAQAAFNNDENNVATYGRLYNWYAATDPRGLCPTGWRVPTADEFNALITELGGTAVAGQKLKSSASDSPAWNGTNASGFNGLGGGLRDNGSGAYGDLNNRGLHWSSTASTGLGAWSLRIYNGSNVGEVGDSYSLSGYRDGMSVRCIAEDATSTTAAMPIALTNDVSDLATEGATLNGQILSDGGAPVSAAGFIWGEQANLSDGTSLTGSVADGEMSATLSNLVPGTTYYYVAFTTNSTATVYGDTLSFSTTFNCGTTNYTFDGYGYATVEIDGACWFAENLRSEHFANGDLLTSGLSNAEWSSTTSPATTVYEEGSANAVGNLAAYGRLYNFFAVEDARGLCPTGWHIPTDDEWKELEGFMGMSEVDQNKITVWRGTDQGHRLKAAAPVWNGSDELGFQAVSSGTRSPDGSFIHATTHGPIWSSTRSGSSAYYRDFYFQFTTLWRGAQPENQGYAVRCLEGAPVILAAPTVTTTATSNLYSACTNVASSVLTDGNSPVTTSGFIVGTQANLSDGASITGELDGTNISGQLSSLTPGSTYYVCAFATNAVGTGYGDTLSFSTPTFVCGTDELNYNGYAYSTVQIGSQCWFDENLRTTTYSNGDSIPTGLSNSEWVSTSEGAMTVYGEGGASESTNLATYGRLYNGLAAQDARNLCPCGWHVPTDAEFVALEDHVGGLSVAGTALKASSPAWNGTDAVQFNALPGGGRNWQTGGFILQGTDGYWWATDVSPTSGWTHQMLSGSAGVNRYFTSNIRDGLSIRCIADNGTTAAPVAPTVESSPASDVGDTGVTLNAAVLADGGAAVTATGFVWGEQADLSDGTSAAGSGTSGAFTAALTGLTEGTTYYFVAFATNSTGTDYGDTLTFTTLAPQFANLLLNGGAESGLDNWTVTTGAVESNTAGQCGSTSQRSGVRFFTAGGACAKTALGRMHQDVSVDAYAADIDAGTYEVRATAWMRNWSAGNDLPEFRVVFLDETSTELSSTPYTSGSVSVWTEFTIEVPIPQGTRAIRYELQGTRFSGGDNDSYFDDMTLGVGFSN